MEQVDQAWRDRKMQDAQREADQGSELLRRALASVPGAVRERYPVQCQSLSSMEVPLLAQPHVASKMLEFFGGGTANLLAEWHSGDQLRRNAAVIARCASVATSQEHVLRQLEGQVRQDAGLAGEQRERVRGGIEAEKERIVEDLRRRSDGSASGQKPESPRSAKPTGRAATERVAGDGSGSTGLAMAATMPIAVGREVTTDPIAAAPVVVQPVVGGSVPMGMPIS